MMKTMRIFAAGLVLGGFGVGALGTVTAQPDSERRVVNLPGRTAANPLFSDAIQVGDTIYLAGRLGLDPETGAPPAAAGDEARIVLDQISAVLAEAGMTMDDLVSVQVFCSDVALYDDFNAVYRTYFTSDPPARAFLGSGTLLRGARFEVMGIAVRS
jgi:reactive intermediate/imine deaminase